MPASQKLYLSELSGLKRAINAGGVQLSSWLDWGITPRHYRDRLVTVKLRPLEEVLQTLTSCSPTRVIMPGGVDRYDRVFIREDQSQIPYVEICPKGIGETFLDAVGEVNDGDTLVITSKFLPVNPTNSVYKQKRMVIVVGNNDIDESIDLVSLPLDTPPELLRL